jgi:hypothetical protein
MQIVSQNDVFVAEEFLFLQDKMIDTNITKIITGFNCIVNFCVQQK